MPLELCLDSEGAQQLDFIAQIAQDCRCRQRRDFGEARCHSNAFGQRAPRVFENVDDLQPEVILQMLLADRFEIGDGLS